MKILAIDHGTKRIGFAISDELGITAKPLEVIHTKNSRQAIDLTIKLINKTNPHLILIGIPLSFNDSGSTQTEIIKSFAKEIREKTGFPIKFWDESYSSVEVGAKKRKKYIDSEAAKIILQEFLKAQTPDLTKTTNSH